MEMFVRLSDSCKRELHNTKTGLAVPHCKRLLDRNASHIRVLSYRMIFPLKSNLLKSMKLSKITSAMSSPNCLLHPV